MSRIHAMLAHLELQQAQGRLTAPQEAAGTARMSLSTGKRLASRTGPIPLRYRIMHLRALVDVKDERRADAYVLPTRDLLIPSLLASRELGSVVGVEDSDAAGIRESGRRQALAEVPSADELAAYRSPVYALAETQDVLSVADDQWGITLHTAGIELLADTVFGELGLDRTDALIASIAVLLAHEYTHFLIDAAVMFDDVARSYLADSHQPGRLTHDLAHPGHCLIEEAVAEAQALRFLTQAEGDGVLPAATGDAFRGRVAAGLPGYNDAMRYVDPDAFESALGEILAHAGVSTTLGQTLLVDVAERQTSLDDVPVHVSVSEGSAYAQGAWRWAEVE